MRTTLIVTSADEAETMSRNEKRLRKWLFGILITLTFVVRSYATITLSYNVAYNQNFDSLASSGTPAWTDNSTIAGWYSSRTAYTPSSDLGTSGGLYSYGVAGVNAITDRALGSLATGPSGTIFYGAAFQVAATTTSLLIKYEGEQWRKGDNANTLAFAYFVGDPTSVSSGEAGWTPVTGLNFTGPQSGSPNAALDGNAAANRSSISFTINGLNIASGSDVWIRWSDPDNAGNDAGLAIDNFAITAVPEPAGWGLISGGALFAIFVLRARRDFISRNGTR